MNINRNTGAHYPSLLLIAAFLIIIAGVAWYAADQLNRWQLPGAAVCFEDMPCWDCETMGNQVCGNE